MITTLPQLPFSQEDLIGNAHQYYADKQTFFILGRNLVVNNTSADLWEGPTTTYLPPASAIQMMVKSTSANDTIAGTGIRSVHLIYLDNSYNVQSLDLDMNGTTGY